MATIDPATGLPVTNTNAGGGLINAPAATTPASVGVISPTPDASIPQITTVPQVAANTYDAAQNSVDRSATVAGQFADLTQQGSPLIDMARTKAKEQMNGMGLLNSSMAIGAADQAAYNAALPIASADAATHATAARENTAATNSALASNTAGMNDANKLNLSAQIEGLKANMDAATKTKLAGVEADYKTLIQTSASASEIYKGALTSINSILQNEKMDSAAKATAINGIYSNMASAMNLVGSINGVQLSGTDPVTGQPWNLLDFGEATAVP